MSHLHQEQSKSFYQVGYLVSIKIRKKTKLSEIKVNNSLYFVKCVFCNFTDDDDDNNNDDDNNDNDDDDGGDDNDVR